MNKTGIKQVWNYEKQQNIIVFWDSSEHFSIESINRFYVHDTYLHESPFGEFYHVVFKDEDEDEDGQDDIILAYYRKLSIDDGTNAIDDMDIIVKFREDVFNYFYGNHSNLKEQLLSLMNTFNCMNKYIALLSMDCKHLSIYERDNKEHLEDPIEEITIGRMDLNLLINQDKNIIKILDDNEINYH